MLEGDEVSTISLFYLIFYLEERNLLISCRQRDGLTCTATIVTFYTQKFSLKLRFLPWIFHDRILIKNRIIS